MPYEPRPIRRLITKLLLICFVLVFRSQAFAADTILCSDDDDNGVVSVLKSVGKIDRDCDGSPSVADGGTDCDDTDAMVEDGSYTIAGCSVGAYRYCDGGTFKTAPGGSTAVANGGQGCTTTTIAEKTNNYYVSATGSGTTCSYASPCLPSAVSSGGAVTPVAPYAIYTVGSTDFSGSMKLAIVVSGSSAGNKSIVARDPLSTAKWNTNASCAAPCSTITISANYVIVRGNEVTGGDATSSGGIRLDGSDIEAFNNYVHDPIGANNNNVAGIYLKDGGSNINVHDNIVNNTQDSTLTTQGGSRHNVWNIGAFEGENLKIDNNRVGYDHAVNTVPYVNQGGGIRFKHGSVPASVTLRSYARNNIIYNTERGGTVSEGAKRWITGNLIVGSSTCHGEAGSSGPGAGNFTYLEDRKWANNTCVPAAHYIANSNTSQAISIIGNAGSQAIDGSVAGGIVLSGNVINDSAQTTYGGGNFLGMLGLQPYGPDANYTILVTNRALESSGNCFYNSNIAALTSGFPVFTDNGSTSFGATVNFANWKLSPYLQDTTSVNGNPSLDADYRVTANCTLGMGWESAWPTASSPSSSGTRRKGQLNYSGRKGQ